MSEGYTTDLVYPSAFGAFQAPIHMAYAAALGGRGSASLSGSFRYADLGMGAGFTLCVLADCYPQAEFHGVDLNPAHVVAARRLAAAAGLDNVTIHEASFADLALLDIGAFDFVGVSGIYSWLDPALRSALLRWIGQQLSPGGLLFLHYASLPGNSQIDALYALIREIAADLPGDSLERFRAATDLMLRMSAAGARFFATNPYAAAWLKSLPEQDQRSMAHEVLNAQPRSLSLRDASSETAAHGLGYVANAQLELNHLPLVAPPSLRDALAAQGIVAREMMLDAVRNAHSRMDIHALADGQPVAFAQAAGSLFVDRLSIGPLSEERQKLSDRSGVDFTAAIHDDLLARIGSRPVTVAELLADDALAQHSADARQEALQYLVATKLVHLLVRPYVRTAGARPRRIASRLNRILLEEQIDVAGQIPLASAVAGTQLLLPPADRLALLALVDGDFAAAWRRVEAAGQVIRFQGRQVTDARALEAVARQRAAGLEPLALATLEGLGILV